MSAGPPLRPNVRIHPVAEWLLRNAGPHDSAEQLFSDLNERLIGADIPVWRASCNVHTLHSEVYVRNLVWTAGEGCTSETISHFDVQSATFTNSPVAAIYRGSDPIRRRLIDGADLDYPICHDLARQGATDYLIMPLLFSDGRRTYVSFATRDDSGFTEEAVQTLVDVSPYLALRLELESSYFATSSLLQLYLGNKAAERVLAGNFKRGKGQRMDAVVWYCDLRGFTELTSGVAAPSVVSMLDQYFEIVADAVRDHGGEILKFIGDAVLAVFDVAGCEPREVAHGALAAAEAALERADELNAQSGAELPIRMGIALHSGTLFFGNVGGQQRLDFTAIGSVVNEVARLEPMCKVHEVSVVVSETFAELVGRETLRSLGVHELRGVQDPMEIFTVTATPA